jgi:phosphate transport system ATP-binding protein
MSVGEPQASASSATGATSSADSESPIIRCEINRLYYGDFVAVKDTQLEIARHKITAFIGPSGCGKSTVLRSLNRLNDIIKGFRLDGRVLLDGRDLYAADVDPVRVRRHIGMVFQQPTPFVKSIFENVAFGLRINRDTRDLDQRVEQALRGAALWDEVKDKLKKNALSLSGGQQQRLCIARAIATQPQVLLMDEPCSALDPISTARVEELMLELAKTYSIAIVTHNLHQAMRVADTTAFMYVNKETRAGYLVECGPTEQLFKQPKEEYTKQYVAGHFS